MCISVSTHTIQCCLKRNGLYGNNHDEPHFTNHVTLLLSLILPKRSWIKKIAFGNKYYGVMEENLSFLDIVMYRRLGARKGRLSSQRNSANVKTWRRLDDALGLF